MVDVITCIKGIKTSVIRKSRWNSSKHICSKFWCFFSTKYIFCHGINSGLYNDAIVSLVTLRSIMKNAPCSKRKYNTVSICWRKIKGWATFKRWQMSITHGAAWATEKGIKLDWSNPIVLDDRPTVHLPKRTTTAQAALTAANITSS